MKEETLEQILQRIAEEDIPGDRNLWPGILVQLEHNKLSIRSKRRGWRAAATLAGVIALSVLLFLIFPGLKTGVAFSLEAMGALFGVGVTSENDQVVSFGPPPTFIVKQPGYLPAGYTRTAEEYYPGYGELPAIRNEITSPESSVNEQEPRPTLSIERFSGPYIILRYEARPGQYIELVERPVAPDDELPAGERITISGQVATVERREGLNRLVWISDGVWIELQGTLPESELVKVAEGLTITQTPSDFLGPLNEVYPPEESSDRLKSSFCNPNDYSPMDEPLLGKVADQEKWGAVIIQFWERDFAPIDVFGGGFSAEMLERALTALQSPANSMQQLSYPAIGGPYMWADDKPCLIVEPSKGYIVIEVWDSQVNIGYGGAGAELKDLAIEALKAEIQKWR